MPVKQLLKHSTYTVKVLRAIAIITQLLLMINCPRILLIKELIKKQMLGIIRSQEANEIKIPWKKTSFH